MSSLKDERKYESESIFLLMNFKLKNQEKVSKCQNCKSFFGGGHLEQHHISGCAAISIASKFL